MNSKFKTLLMTLVLVPCIFVFAGCNPAQLDQEIKLDTSGTYAESTSANAKSAVENSDIDDFFQTETYANQLYISFHANMGENSIKGSLSVITKATLPSETKMHSESAMRLRIEEKKNGKTFKTVISTYNIINQDLTKPVEEGTTIDSYIDYSMPNPLKPEETTSGKYKITSESEFNGVIGQITAYAGQMMTIIQEYMPVEETTWDALWNTNDYKFAVSTKDKTTKIKITTPEIVDGTDTIPATNIYYIIQDGKFAGMQIDEMTIDFQEMSMSITCAVKPFSGDIQYPNFKDYKTPTVE